MSSAGIHEVVRIMTKQDTKRVVILPLGIIERIHYITLALDPGGTTGYCYYVPWTGEVTCGQLGPEPHHIQLFQLIEKLLAEGDGRLVIVYERFEFRQSEEKMRTALRNYITILRRGTVTKLAVVVRELERIVGLWTGRDKLVLDSKEYIGVIKLAVQTYEGVTVHSHNASEGKYFIDDNKLTALGWYRLTQALPHARDSLRHLLRHLTVTCEVQEPITTAWFGSRKGIGSS